MTEMLLWNPLLPVVGKSEVNISLVWLASYLINNEAPLDSIKIYDSFVDRESSSPVYHQNVLEKRIRDLGSEDYLAIGANTHAYGIAVRMLSKAKANLGYLPITILGGPHATALPRNIMEETELFDYAVRYIGGEPVRMIIEGKKEVPNTYWREDGRIVNGPEREILPDVNMKMATDLMKSFIFSGVHFVPMISTLGCVNDCHYCSSPKYGEKGFLLRDPKVVAEEIDELVSLHNPDAVRFYDDSHMVDKKHVAALNEELIQRGVDVDKGSMIDPLTMNGDMFELCKSGRYKFFFMGRDYVTNEMAGLYGRTVGTSIRNVEHERGAIENIIERLHESQFTMSYVLPGPYDDMGYVRLAISEMLDLKAENVQFRFGPLTPYPGTATREKMLTQNLIPKEYLESWILHDCVHSVIRLDERVSNWYLAHVNGRLLMRDWETETGNIINDERLFLGILALNDKKLLEGFIRKQQDDTESINSFLEFVNYNLEPCSADFVF